MESIRDEFLSHFPDLFLRGAVSILGQCYRDAHAIGTQAGLDEDHNRWNLPYARRALFEQRLYDLAGKQGVPLEVSKAFAKGESTPYTVIRSGPFFFTASYVDAHGALPRECRFRKGNAKCNYSLFADPSSDCDDPTRYAILSHGATASGSEAKWVEVIFPDASYERVAAKVDLLERYTEDRPALPVVPVVTPVVQVPDEAQPKLKKRGAQKRKAE